MSSSSEKSSRRHTVGPDQSVDLNTAFRETIEIPRSASALVRVYTPKEYDGPDALVFCSIDGFQTDEGPGPERCLYWKEKKVSDGDSRGDRECLELCFTQKENDSTKTDGPAPGRSALREQEYALLWYPSGDTETEPVWIFFGESFEEVWSVGDVPSVMAHFGAVQFEECCAVTLPGETPRSYDPEDPYRREKDDPRLVESDDEGAGGAQGGQDASQTGASGQGNPDQQKGTRPDMTVRGSYAEPVRESSAPVQTRSTSAEKKEAQGQKETESAQGETDSASEKGFEWPAGERWVHLFLRDDGDEGDDRSVQHLGTYRATADGTYKWAEYGEDGALSVTGDPQEQVLLPYNAMGLGQRRTVLARLSLVTVSREWVNAQKEALTGWLGHGEASTFVPFAPAVRRKGNGDDVQFGLLDQGPYLGGAMYKGSLGMDALKQEGEAAQLRLLLPNPLAVAERRLGVASAAKERFRKWMQKMGEAGLMTELTSATCHGTHNQRSYLSDGLKKKQVERTRSDDATALAYGTPVGGGQGTSVALKMGTIKKKYDMVTEWAPLTEDTGATSDEPTEEASDGESSEKEETAPNAPAERGDTSLAAHFSYGARRPGVSARPGAPGRPGPRPAHCERPLYVGAGGRRPLL